MSNKRKVSNQGMLFLPNPTDKKKKRKVKRIGIENKLVYVTVPDSGEVYQGRVYEDRIARKALKKKYHFKIEVSPGIYRYANKKNVVFSKPKKTKSKRVLSGVHNPLHAFDRTVIEPPILDRDKVVTLEKFWDFLDSKAKNKGHFACACCHNGSMYPTDTYTVLAKDKLDKFLNLSYLKGSKYIILVPERMFVGRVPLKERKKVRYCDRCRGGRYTKLNPHIREFTNIDHVGLFKKAFIGVISI